MGTREGGRFTFCSGGERAVPGHWWLAEEMASSKVPTDIEASEPGKDAQTFHIVIICTFCNVHCLLKLSQTLNSSQTHQCSYFSVLTLLNIPTASVLYRVLQNQLLLKKSTNCKVLEDWDVLAMPSTFSSGSFFLKLTVALGPGYQNSASSPNDSRVFF